MAAGGGACGPSIRLPGGPRGGGLTTGLCCRPGGCTPLLCCMGGVAFPSGPLTLEFPGKHSPFTSTAGSQPRRRPSSAPWGRGQAGPASRCLGRAQQLTEPPVPRLLHGHITVQQEGMSPVLSNQTTCAKRPCTPVSSPLPGTRGWAGSCPRPAPGAPASQRTAQHPGPSSVPASAQSSRGTASGAGLHAQAWLGVPAPLWGQAEPARRPRP